MSDDDEIHPWNGHSGTPQDKLASGCGWIICAIPAVALWIICAIPVVAFLIFLAQLAEHWWKGTP